MYKISLSKTIYESKVSRFCYLEFSGEIEMSNKKNDLKTLIRGAVIGGVIYFVWTNISWMALGWHNAYKKPVPNESAVAEVIRSEFPEEGLYFIPWHDKDGDPEVLQQKMETGPFAFMMIQPKGMSFNMGAFMGRSFLLNCLMAMLATWLLLHTSGLSFCQKVGFVIGVGLCGSSWMVFANWNWWGYPNTYLIVNILDLIAAWTLVGLGLSKFVVKN